MFLSVEKLFVNWSNSLLYAGRARAPCRIISGTSHCLWFMLKNCRSRLIRKRSTNTLLFNGKEADGRYNVQKRIDGKGKGVALDPFSPLATDFPSFNHLSSVLL